MKKVQITIVDFYAFGQKTNKVFVDATDEFIKDDLRNICNSNLIISVRQFEAVEVEPNTNLIKTT